MSGVAADNRIVARLAAAREAGRIGLMPFLCAGHPTIETTASALVELDRAGADIAEVGIPFSDPIADGPVIASAMHEAIGRGVTWRDAFESVRTARAAGAELGVVAMVSASIVLRVGLERFTEEAAAAGVDGLIIPDAPLGEAEEMSEAAASHGLTNALLVAPSTPIERAKRIAEASTGFVYVVARSGVTGDSAEPPPELTERLASLRGATALPLAVGFGVSKAEHVRALRGHADAAIVGTALVRRMGEAEDAAAEAGRFVASLA